MQLLAQTQPPKTDFKHKSSWDKTKPFVMFAVVMVMIFGGIILLYRVRKYMKDEGLI